MNTALSIFYVLAALAIVAASWLVGLNWMSELSDREATALILWGIGFAVFGAALRHLIARE